MDGILPLAMLTLLATVSISCPIFAVSRLVRRVVRPAHHPETDVKPEPPLYMFLLRALLSIVAPTRVDHRSLAALHDQIGPGLTNPKSSHYENALTEVDASNLDTENADLPSPDTQERAHTDATPAFLSSSARIRNPCQRILQDSRAFVEFTIGWDDIWPDLPSSPRVTYTYNSYFNAFTASRAAPDPLSARSNPHSHADSTPPAAHDDDESSEDEEMDYALLEIASQSADEDLIWALQSLSLSDPPSSSSSSPSSPPPPPLPAAGVSPFCPPPVPRAVPSSSPSTPQTPSWRLEWY